MRLVWLSHLIPYPPRGGGRQRTFSLLRHISRKYETTFVALNLLGESKRQLEEYKAEFKKLCAQVEFWETPFRWQGPRWWAQLPFSPFYYQHYPARSLWSPHLNAHWRKILDTHRGELVNFETIDLALYFPAAEGFCRVLNHQNCESAMAERRAENATNPLTKAYLHSQALKIARLERSWCPQFDTNLAVSELDAERLRSRCPGSHFHVVENGTDLEYFTPSDISPEPKSLVFAGGLSWYPNVSAVRFFTGEIWPMLKRRCPGIRLYLAGRSPADSVIEIARRDPDITLVSDPEDIRPWIWKAAVYVCPIRDGGGTRLKILDALALGKAVVSTSIGYEGLKVNPEEDILVADTAPEFARQVLRLLGDAGLRARLGANGRRLVERLYGWEAISRHLDQAFRFALDSPGRPSSSNGTTVEK